MGKKRKLEPSEALETMLLDLAGMASLTSPAQDPSSTATTTLSPSELLAQAAQLKRTADRLDAPTKYLFYIRSALRSLEYVATETDPKLLTPYLRDLAQILEFAARKTHSIVRSGLKTQSSVIIKDYLHLAVVSHRLAGVVRMHRLKLMSEKLRKFWESCRGYEKKLEKAERVRKVQGQFFMNEEERRQGEANRRYLVQEGDDGVAAMEHWRAADELLKEVREAQLLTKHIEQRIPAFNLIDWGNSFTPLVLHVRKSLDQIYS